MMRYNRKNQWFRTGLTAVIFLAVAGFATAEGPLPSSEPAGEYTVPNWEQYFVEPQPDMDEYWETQDNKDIATKWTGFYYFNAPGAAFRPRDAVDAWNYSGAGCVNLDSTNGFLTLHLDIPNGARIDYLRLFFYDLNASYSNTAYITNYDGAGGYVDLTNVSSDVDTGYGTTLSPFVDHVVDSINNGYLVMWSPGSSLSGTSQRLCGVRVAYRLAN